jgi:hypothetical protein
MAPVATKGSRAWQGFGGRPRDSESDQEPEHPRLLEPRRASRAPEPGEPSEHAQGAPEAARDFGASEVSRANSAARKEPRHNTP